MVLLLGSEQTVVFVGQCGVGWQKHARVTKIVLNELVQVQGPGAVKSRLGKGEGHM
ncbi:MAG: hypothetical protein ABSC91_09690 [Candidatus Bathyarchaeia archaeon]